LIQIKCSIGPVSYDARATWLERFMAVQNILILVGIVSSFLLFGISLAWADFYSQRREKPAVDEHQGTQAKKAQPRSIEERRAA
jgi:hypothetical protein